jgi:chromosomal replication initiation ATPase DnaA
LWIYRGHIGISQKNPVTYVLCTGPDKPVDIFNTPDIWTDALAALRPRLDPHTYEMWLRPIQYRGLEAEQLLLSAPNRFLKEWFETHYLGLVLDQIHTNTARRLDARVDVNDTAPVVASPPPAVAHAAEYPRDQTSRCVHFWRNTAKRSFTDPALIQATDPAQGSSPGVQPRDPAQDPGSDSVKIAQGRRSGG